VVGSLELDGEVSRFLGVLTLEVDEDSVVVGAKHPKIAGLQVHPEAAARRKLDIERVVLEVLYFHLLLGNPRCG
jgi:hypothetical protein